MTPEEQACYDNLRAEVVAVWDCLIVVCDWGMGMEARAMSDIVKRLRGIRICENFALVEQAADEIESLRSRLADIESQNRVMWDVANDREARLADWHRMADERSAEIVRLSTRLAEAERIVRAVDKVGAEAIANGGRIELTQGAVLFTAAANYLVNCRSASDSASGDEGWGKVCAHCGR